MIRRQDRCKWIICLIHDRNVTHECIFLINHNIYQWHLDFRNFTNLRSSSWLQTISCSWKMWINQTNILIEWSYNDLKNIWMANKISYDCIFEHDIRNKLKCRKSLNLNATIFNHLRQAPTVSTKSFSSTNDIKNFSTITSVNKLQKCNV